MFGCVMSDLRAPAPPAESEYNCADLVEEEVLLFQFAKIASPTTSTIDITSDELRTYVYPQHTDLIYCSWKEYSSSLYHLFTHCHVLHCVLASSVFT